MKKSISSGNLSHQFDASTDLRISGAWRWCADSAAVGRRLCSLRKECSLTQQMLSDIICANCAETASVNTISSWERGKKLPSLVHLMFLQGLYGVSLDVLLPSYAQTSDEDSAQEGEQPSPFFGQTIYRFWIAFAPIRRETPPFSWHKYKKEPQFCGSFFVLFQRRGRSAADA